MPDETNEVRTMTLPAAVFQPPSTNRQPFEIVHSPAAITDPGTAALAPQTASAFAGTGRGAKALGLIPDFTTRNAFPGIPLDTETGVTTWDRLQLARRSAEQDQFAYLRNKYGEAVRKSDTGEWIVRVPDEETGKEKDIVANPHKMTVGDLGALAGHFPEIAAWVAGEKGLRAIPMLGRMRGLGGAIRDVVGGAAGAETLGTVQDIETRFLEDQTPLEAKQFKEILGRRIGGFAGDVAVGAPLMGAAKFITWMRNPFGGLATDIQFDAVAAQKALFEKTGILVPMNLAETSGNPDIVRRFRQLKRLPGSSEAMAEYQQRQQGELQKLQDIIIGTDTADETKLGRQAMGIAESKMAPLLEGESSARFDVSKQGETQIGDLVSSATTPIQQPAEVVGATIRKRLTEIRDASKLAVNNLYKKFQNLAQSSTATGPADIENLVAAQTLPEKINNATYVGDVIRNRLVELRDTAKSNVDALYEQFKKQGGSTAMFKSDELSTAAEKIMEDLPPQFKQTEAGVEKVGPSGAFASEPAVLRRLKELADAKGASYRFSDLQQMRSEVYDDMAKSEAVAGLSKRHLSQIAGIITDAMEKGINQIGDPALKDALRTANEAYKTQLVPFGKKGIDEIFANEFEKAHLFPGQVSGSFVEGRSATDRYNLLQQFLGAGSTEMNVLNRHIADALLTEGQTLGEPLNPKTFLSKLSQFSNDNPQMAAQVLGGKHGALADAAKSMMLSAETTEKDKLLAKEVVDIFESGKIDPAAFQRLTGIQKEIQNPLLKQSLKDVNDAYKSNLLPFDKKGISEIFKSEFDSGHIFPGQLASSFLSGADATDRYNLLNQFLGAGSNEMRALNRHIADALLQRGQILGAETINAKTFLKNLSQFYEDKPEIAKQIFGTKQAQMIDTAKTMILAQETDKLPVKEVEKLMAAGKADTTALQRLMHAQKALDEKTSNSILDAIKRKSVTGLDVSAEEIVTRWIPKASRSEIAQFMAMLADRPALVDDIRSIYAQQLFAKSAESGKSVFEALRRAYGDQKGRILLGEKMFEDLQQFGALQTGINVAKGGDLGASQAAMSRLDQALIRPLTFLPQALREWVTAKVLTSQPMRNWALASKPEEAGTILLVLSSPPFVQAVADTFRPGRTAQNVMRTIHNGVGDWFKSLVTQQKSDQESQQRMDQVKSKTMTLPMSYFGKTNQPPAQP